MWVGGKDRSQKVHGWKLRVVSAQRPDAVAVNQPYPLILLAGGGMSNRRTRIPKGRQAPINGESVRVVLAEPRESYRTGPPSMLAVS
jgi:hypothetical protein